MEARGFDPFAREKFCAALNDFKYRHQQQLRAWPVCSKKKHAWQLRGGCLNSSTELTYRRQRLAFNRSVAARSSIG
jgi:hypothetical protein